MTQLDYASGIDLLQGQHSIAVCGHVNPDGDSLGSTLALTLGLRGLGYDVTPLLATREKPRLYDFLEGYEDLIPACEYHGRPDVFILVDVPNAQRAGDAEYVFRRAKKTMVIDHHQGDAAFADVGFVDSTAAAAGMLVWDFLEQSGAELTAPIATCCYTALVTDTGRFQFQNADARALRAAADFAQAGAIPSEVARFVYQRRSWAALQLEALVVERMELLFDGKVVLSWVTEADFKEIGASKEDGDSLIDAIRQLDGVDVAVMLREQGPIVRGSIRSKTDRDVAAIAAKMNGGGHKAAAGFTVHDTLDKALVIVKGHIAQAIEEQPEASVSYAGEVTNTMAFSKIEEDDR